MFPRDVPCPHCGAKIDHGCHSKNNPLVSTTPHRARWMVVGITYPQSAELEAEARDGYQRDLEFREKFFAEMRATILPESVTRH